MARRVDALREQIATQAERRAERRRSWRQQARRVEALASSAPSSS